MITQVLKFAVAGLAMMLGSLSVQAAEVTLLISNVFTAAMEDLAPRFEKSSGHKLLISYGSTNPLKVRIEKGEAFDLTILGEAALDDLIKQGRLLAPTRAVIAKSGMGVAIRKGAPHPGIGTTEAFKRALINAKSIAYSEQGLSGVYLRGLFQRLDIAEVLKSKTRDARAAEAVAKGETEIGITQISEIVAVAGVELAGPLPAELQNYTIFAAAVDVGARQPDAAAALLKYFALPETARVLKANGLEPPG